MTDLSLEEFDENPPIRMLFHARRRLKAQEEEGVSCGQGAVFDSCYRNPKIDESASDYLCCQKLLVFEHARKGKNIDYFYDMSSFQAM